MKEDQLTFEEVNKHFESVNLLPFQKEGKNFFTADNIRKKPGDVLQKVCAAYNIIRPFLVLVFAPAIFPKKWKDAIKTFMDLMDTFCR
jgi:hypothetical protein